MSARVRPVCAAAVAVALAATAVAPLAVAAPRPPGESAAALPDGPPGSSAPALLNRLQTLYRQTEEATEAYKTTDVELKRREAEDKRFAASLATARTALAQSRSAAGRLAREQYQGRSDLSTYLRVLLADDPQSALDQGHVLARAAGERQATVDRLTRSERQAADLARASRRALDEQQALAKRQQQEKEDVERRLKEVEKLLADLSPDQLAELGRLEQQGTDRAQQSLLASGALSSTRAPSSEGDRALTYAVDQIGKPYVWGAEGPESYDCSGLTSQAWSHAGRSIPRTSQEQWAELPHIALTSLRPGDLVVYFPTATHVAMYLGDGLVVQAPRPGARVKVSPIAANPLLGAVRPDPAAASLTPLAYHPPKLPEGAAQGVDTGYSSEGEPE
ncbi:C40 family peptidase [Streptomyces sp. NBC_00083]|uniref:C40 family peptidase n=1 Tax=Streptomyces sp. NBC_00083 TaxID=2975647 RepID=UPI00224DA98D|nr:C40 family peptidase [Streptomyces sp. NBC_00083]MCX5385643.1 NlpC/P60 family protein [Streptomyces sp. NBC_00083]